MKLWMSGEIMGNIGDEYASARREINKEINQILSCHRYAEGIDEWAFLAIILDLGYDAYPEVRRYHKSDKSFEFRLKIPHAEFKAADPNRQRGLIIEALLRSLDDMAVLIKKRRLSTINIDFGGLKAAIRELAVSKRWPISEGTVH